MNSTEITNHVLAYQMTDNQRVKKRLIEIVFKNMMGMICEKYKDFVPLVKWEYFPDFCSICLHKIIIDADKFDKNKGVKFPSFAVWGLKSARNILMRSLPPVHLPANRKWKDFTNVIKSGVSMHTQCYDDDKKTIGDTLQAEEEKGFEFDPVELLKDKISPRDQNILEGWVLAQRIYGSGTGGKMIIMRGITGVTRERIRQRLEKIEGYLFLAMKNDWLINRGKFVVTPPKPKKYTLKKEEFELAERENNPFYDLEGCACEVRR
jgi:hypothetical protein